MRKAAVTIVGAGVVGLAVAAQVAGKYGETYILEKNDGFGKETSSRSSETIHAGIYYPEGSLKAGLCVEGNALTYELCERHGIPHLRTGKLIVAVTAEEVGKLEALAELAGRNGARGLKMLASKGVKADQPNVRAFAALLSTSSGVVDSHSLMKFLLASAREKGVEVAYRCRVVGIGRLPRGGYEITVRDPSGTFSFQTEVLVNSAGLHSDRMAELAGIDIDTAGYRIRYCKGEYFAVASGKQNLVSRLVYPVPDPSTGGLGIHSTFDVEGRMRLGPNAVYVTELDYSVDPSHRDDFRRSVEGYFPFVQSEDLEPDIAGIRPKLEAPNGQFRDFVIRHEGDRGLEGLINLIGIESPGLTAAPAVAGRVERMVRDLL